MAKPTPWKDEYTLLCEKCGYVVEGLDTSGPCPECGKPIEESLPCQRPGTPWQRRQSLFALFRTWYSLLRHPKRTFDEMNSIEQDGMSLTAVGLCFSVVSVFVLILVFSIILDVESSFGGLIVVFVIGIVYWVIAFAYAWLAAYRIEMWTRKKYRIDSHSSWAIAGHASLGLCVPPIVILLCCLLFMIIWIIDSVYPTDLERAFYTIVGIAYLLILASFPTGLVLFEVLCTIGVRRCKFRNYNSRTSFDLAEPTQSDTRTT